MNAAALTILLLDRERPTAQQTLSGWLGAENATRATMRCPERYILIATFDTGGDPRYVHLTEFLTDLETLIARLMMHIEAAELSPVMPQPCAIDMRFSLDPAERDRINAILDGREASQLLHARARGHA